MTSGELPALLLACKQEPDDLTRRAVLADWLDDHDQADLADCVRLSLAEGRLIWTDLRSSYLRAMIHDPRRPAMRLLDPLRRLPRVEFSRGLLRVAVEADQLDKLSPDDLPAPQRHWLETIYLAGNDRERLFAVARRGWLVPFTGIELATSYYSGEMLARLLRDRVAFPADHIGRLAHLNLTGNNLHGAGFAELLDALRPCVGLRSLRLSFNRGLDDEDVRLLAGSPVLGRLTSLSLTGTAVTHEGVRALALSPHAGNLRRLDLALIPLRRDTIEALCEGNLPRLECLDLGACRLRSPAVEPLLNWPADRRLRDLDLGGNNLANPAARTLARSPVVAHLDTLDLHANNFSGDGLAPLFAALPGCLGKLALGSLPLSTESFRKLARAANLAGLRELNLEESGLTPDGLEHLVQSAPLRNLEVLDLAKTHLGPHGLRCLTATDAFPNLHSLDLTNVRPTRKGIETLARSTWLQRVRVLTLRDNRLDPAGAQILARSPQLTGLRFLTLSSNKLGAEGIRHFIQSPHLAELIGLGLNANGATTAVIRELARSPALPGLTWLELWDTEVEEEAACALLDRPSPPWVHLGMVAIRFSAATQRRIDAARLVR